MTLVVYGTIIYLFLVLFLAHIVGLIVKGSGSELSGCKKGRIHIRLVTALRYTLRLLTGHGQQFQSEERAAIRKK